MRVVPIFVGCLIAVVSAGAASAQPAPPAPTPPTPTPGAPAPSAPPLPAAPAPASTIGSPSSSGAAPGVPEERDDAAWRLYHDAFGALLDGKRKRAAILVGQLRREHAGHPATALVATTPLDAATAVDGPRRARVEQPSAAASAELALFQTLHGLVVGVELCFIIECDSPEAGFGLALAGGAIGAVGSLKVVGPITSGQRALLNSGTLWGAFNAGMVVIASDPDDEKTILLGMLAGQGAGLAAGALLFRARPTAGQVGLVSSGGQWAAVLMGLTIAATDRNPTEAEIALSLMLATDAGLGLGAYLAWLRPDVGRAQTLVIDAGGIVGGIGGAGLGVLLSGETDESTAALTAALGVAAGLGVAAYLTRDWSDEGDDDDNGGARPIVMPAAGGHGGLVGLGGTW